VSGDSEIIAVDCAGDEEHAGSDCLTRKEVQNQHCYRSTARGRMLDQ
jgi:hypothetical protein